MLPQVLTALADAQRLGFRHWDLRLKNIMEHHPSQQSRLPAEEGWKAERSPAVASPAATSQKEGQEKMTIVMQPTSGHQATNTVDKDSACDVASNRAPANLQLHGRRHADDKAGGTAAAYPDTRSNGPQRCHEDQNMEAGNCIWRIIDYGHADFGDRALQDDAVCLDGPVLEAEDGCGFLQMHVGTRREGWTRG